MEGGNEVGERGAPCGQAVKTSVASVPCGAYAQTHAPPRLARHASALEATRSCTERGRRGGASTSLAGQARGGAGGLNLCGRRLRIKSRGARAAQAPATNGASGADASAPWMHSGSVAAMQAHRRMAGGAWKKGDRGEDGPLPPQSALANSTRIRKWAAGCELAAQVLATRALSQAPPNRRSIVSPPPD